MYLSFGGLNFVINNKNYSSLNKKQMDDFVNSMIRNEVKNYIKLKLKTNPSIILKENYNQFC